MMKPEPQYDILDMLKTLADESRLRLLRLLAEGEHTGGELAQRVNFGEPTVSHHLSRLRQSGLATLRMAGNQRFYRINDAGLALFKQLAAVIEQQPAAPLAPPADEGWIAQLDWPAEDLQVLRDATTGGLLKRSTTKQKKLLVVLRWLATLFQPERLYTEMEVNEVLKGVYKDDFVSLRRALVDFGYLRRERGGGKYWLAAEEG